MRGIFVLIALAVVILAAVTVRMVRTVESYSEEDLAEASVRELGWGYTVVSLFLWPIAIISFLESAIILIPLFFIIPPRYLHVFVRFFSRFILLSTGVVVRVRGKERLKRPEAYILMFNHQSILDVFILGAVVYRYVTGLAASFQFRLPFWGLLMRRWGIISIPRKKLKEAIKSIDLAREKLESGIPVLVAPEGTRTLDGKMREFKKGPFHLALMSKADILPMGIRGAFDIKQITDWRVRPGVVRVEVGEFIPYAEYEDMSVEELRDYIHGTIKKLAGEIP